MPLLSRTRVFKMLIPLAVCVALILWLQRHPFSTHYTGSSLLEAEELHNIARGKACRLSEHGTRQGDPGKLVDGISGYFDQSAVILNSTDAFWEVDLGEETTVKEILIILHRSALVKSRRCKLMLFSSTRIPVGSLAAKSMVGLFYWNLAAPVAGCRFVRIRTQGDSGLPMEEVEVYGSVPLRPQLQDAPGKEEAHAGGQLPASPEKKKLSLIVSYFEMEYGLRRTEIEQTLRRNLQNPHIAEVHLLLESKVPCSFANTSSDRQQQPLVAPFVHPKLVVFCVNEQPQYRDFFSHANSYLNNQLVIVSNGDIVFTDSLRHISTAIPANSTKAHILSRWPMNCEQATTPEINRCLTIFPSYDAFIFRAPAPEGTVNNMTFYMNRKFAEHEAARALMKVFELSNPCYDVISLHNHCSDVREWDPHRVKIRGGKYEVFAGRALGQNELSAL